MDDEAEEEEDGGLVIGDSYNGGQHRANTVSVLLRNFALSRKLQPTLRRKMRQYHVSTSSIFVIYVLDFSHLAVESLLSKQ